MSKIKNIIGREILDSRGNPTVEVDVILESGFMGRASVPSGASTGSREALELRDKDSRYMGLGVKKAVLNVNTEIRNALNGMDALNQREIDEAMIKLDGTQNKSRLGANAILGVSMATLIASANYNQKPLYKYVGSSTHLPLMMMNILNGGMHSDNNLQIQEFMIVPFSSTVRERIRIGSEVFHTLKKILKDKGYVTSVGDEGGFAPNLSNTHEALDLITEAIIKANYIPGIDVSIALDVAASTFYKDDKYNFEGHSYQVSELISYYEDLINNYAIISIEDPVDENDWEGFRLMTSALGNRIQIVGDDLFVTNKIYLQKGIDNKCGNAILIKLNQIGTITEAIDTISLAKKNNYKTIISHRSGETENTIIADLVVGLDLGQIKTGSLSRTERVCKYNQLMRIEEEIYG